jgi:hypothetical protein
MRKDLEIQVTLSDGTRQLPIFVHFSVIFSQDDGSWDYDWKVNKVIHFGQIINFEFMDPHYKSAIENAIEEKLYKFPFENHFM